MFPVVLFLVLNFVKSGAFFLLPIVLFLMLNFVKSGVFLVLPIVFFSGAKFCASKLKSRSLGALGLSSV